MVSSTVTGDHLYIVGQCQFSSATEAADQLDHLESEWNAGVRTIYIARCTEEAACLSVDE